LAELGLVQVRRAEKVRGNVRLEFVTGGRALARARRDYRLLEEMSKTCSVSLNELAGSVAALRQRTADAEKRALRLAMEAAKREGADLFARTAADADGVRRMVVVAPAISEEGRAAAQAFVEQGKGIALILGTDQNTVLIAAGVQAGLNAGAVLKQAIAQAGGKGGGSAAMAQGSFNGSEGVAVLKGLLGFE
jgi:alanyl-tRNA synthetase